MNTEDEFFQYNEYEELDKSFFEQEYIGYEIDINEHELDPIL